MWCKIRTYNTNLQSSVILENAAFFQNIQDGFKWTSPFKVIYILIFFLEQIDISFSFYQRLFFFFINNYNKRTIVTSRIELTSVIGRPNQRCTITETYSRETQSEKTHTCVRPMLQLFEITWLEIYLVPSAFLRYW